MNASRQKVAHQELGKSFSEIENESILISTFRLKKNSRVVRHGNKDQKSKSYLKKMASPLPKTLPTDHSNRRNGKYAARKLIGRKYLQKKHCEKLLKKKDSEDPQGRNSPVFGFVGNDDNADGTIPTKKQKNKKKRRPEHKVESDEPSRLQRRSKYLLIKMKLEQNLIDAYSGEGWKGQSREKIKPETELMRAKKQILKCKLGLRDVIRQLDSLSTIGRIEDSFMYPDGSVSHEHIFCAKCKLNEVFPDNDIVLCDGRCNCAFHQKCLDPPLRTENIPPGDQGWLCKFCESRIEIIDGINAHLGTQFSLNSDWEDIFRDEAAYPDGQNKLFSPEEDWPSDDSEDDDYDPERRENSISGAGTDDDVSDDPSSSTSLGRFSDADVNSEGINCSAEHEELKGTSVRNNADDATSEGEILVRRRQRTTVDYKMLYNEMFGKDALSQEQLSEDEDWGPRKRKRKEKESDAATMITSLHKSDDSNEKRVDNSETEGEISQLQIRRSLFRFPSFAIEKLRQVFAENELPSRKIKENLAKELGLEPGKVSKWFKNSRYLALKSRKTVRPNGFFNSSPSTPGKIRYNDSIDEDSAFAPTKDASTEAGVLTLKKMKKAIQKKTQSTTYSFKKSRQKEASSCDFRLSKIGMQHSDDVSLKKLLKSTTLKSRQDKPVPVKVSQRAEAELERVCRAKDRLEILRQTLIAIENIKARKSNRSNLLEQRVIFVPVAVLREKSCIRFGPS